jgi:hypothetical protein
MNRNATGETVARHDFARLVAAGTCATVIGGGECGTHRPLSSWEIPPPARFWESVRAPFVMAPGLSVMNAANLCPAPAPVIATLERATSHVDRDPSPQNRARLSQASEATPRVARRAERREEERLVIRQLPTSKSQRPRKSFWKLDVGSWRLGVDDRQKLNPTPIFTFRGAPTFVD